MYFPDDPANGADPVLERVDPARRGTLVAAPSGGDSGAIRWDVVLQGERETVFFEC
jgi:protocatechuate 3,4-dioxygenase alpha subunit